MDARVVAVALSLVLLAGCRKGEDEGSVAAEVHVGTAVARSMAMPQVITATGTVAPRPGHVADLSAPAATRVARVAVALGAAVRAGDVLVEFEQAPFAAAARSAETALATAQAAYDRAARLAQAGVLPRKDVDQAAADLAAAQSNSVTARRSLELATLRAPITGVVTRMDAVMGQPVEANQSLVQVVDPSALDVVFPVSAEAVAGVRAGATVVLFAGEDARGDSLGSARVTAVAAAVDTVTRAVSVRASLGRTARPLRVGEAVSGRIILGVHAGAIVIPAEALVPAGEGFRVFVVTQGLARSHDVRVGSRVDSLVEIREGVAAGDTVVTYGAYGLQDSVKVVRATRP